jgi:hypothetical protein
LAAPALAILALDGWKYLEVIALKLPLSAKVSLQFCCRVCG